MTALLAPFPKFRAEDSAGAALPNALLYTYAAGTTTPLATCKDSTGIVFNSNPVQCDANGYADVWLTAGVAYKFTLTDQYGTIQPGWPVDNITGGIQGAAGVAGSTWYDGSGVPASSLGADGDYYLDTASGDVYTKSAGVWGLRGNIQGPPGSTRNAILNGSFYGGLNCWSAYAAAVNGVVPTAGGGRLPNSKAPNLFAASTLGLVTAVGEVTQGFPTQLPSGTTTLTFYTAAWLESVAPNTAYSAQIKVYIHDAQTDVETLIGTYAYPQASITTTYATATWTQRSIDVSAYLPAEGTYGLRFEMQSISDNTGGAAGSKGIYCGFDDVVMNITSAGVTGPTGPAGPAGPAGPSGGGHLQSQAFTANGTFTVPASVTFLDITAVGAGGGGGAGRASASGAGGGGGGAGATIKRRVPVSALSTYTITIGTKGNGATIGVAATDGTPTTFGSLVSASGGLHGASAVGPTNTPGAGGTGGNGVLTGVGSGYNPVFPNGLATALINGSGAALAGGTGGTGGFGYNYPSAATNGASGGYAESANGGVGGATDGNLGGGGGGGSTAFGVGGAGGAAGSPGVSAALTAYGAGGGAGAGALLGTVGGDGAPGYCLVEYIA